VTHNTRNRHRNLFSFSPGDQNTPVKGSEGCFLLRLREDPFRGCLLGSSGSRNLLGPWCVDAAFRSLVPPSHSLCFLWLSLLLFCPLKRHSLLDLGPNLIQDDLIVTASLITSAETLILNKITSEVPDDIAFGRATINPWQRLSCHMGSFCVGGKKKRLDNTLLGTVCMISPNPQLTGI
jgi:hypothetical protein